MRDRPSPGGTGEATGTRYGFAARTRPTTPPQVGHRGPPGRSHPTTDTVTTLPHARHRPGVPVGFRLDRFFATSAPPARVPETPTRTPRGTHPRPGEPVGTSIGRRRAEGNGRVAAAPA